MGIGPSTKETSKHYFQDPLVKVFSDDLDVDLVGIIVVGTPQDNRMKHLVGERTASLLKVMSVKGAVVSTDGWGNSDVDFANTLEHIGNYGISVQGIKFIGQQAKFVVENAYTGQVIDMNKSEAGIETEVLGENAVDRIDAIKALAKLKLLMRRDEKKNN